MGSQPVGISGSRAAAVLGLSQYQSKLEVWLNIQEQLNPGFCQANNYLQPEPPDNAAIKWGSKFEDYIINQVEKIKNVKLINREKHFTNDFMTCHIDAEIEKLNTLIENKTTSEFYFRDNFGEENTDKIPVMYQIQVQHNLILTGFEKCIMPVVVFPKRPDDYQNSGIDIENIDCQKWIETLSEMGCIKFYEIHPHTELQRLMLSEYEKFWKKNILEKTPPEPETLEDFKRLVRSPVGTIIADENIERWITEKNNIQDEIKSADNRVEQIKLDVLKYCENAVKVTDDDTTNKWIIRSRDGKKLGQYGKNKSGIFSFR